MDELSADEMSCLRGLAKAGNGLPRSCSNKVLLALQRRGLVVRQPRGWLPLENQGSAYLITHSGRLFLEHFLGRRD